MSHSRFLQCLPVVFTNFLKNAHIERLAEADEFQAIKSVKEVYADFYALDKNHFSLEIGVPVVGEQINSWTPKLLQRARDGLIACLLALRKCPSLVRYDGGSLMAQKLALEVKDSIRKEVSLFDGCHSEHTLAPILLILDRRSDLVTPLLLQWTYQALLHDLFGIRSGSVDTSRYLYSPSAGLKEALLPGEHQASTSATRHVFVPRQDEFYAENLHQNFGRVSQNLQAQLQSYQDRKESLRHLESLTGMKKFLEDYPKLTKLGSQLAKHVSVGAEIQNRVNEDRLLEISEIEQTIVCHEPNTKQFEEMLCRPDIKRPLKLKLALLYALQSSKPPLSRSFSLLDFFDLLRRNGFKDDDVELVDFVLKFGQYDQAGHRIDPSLLNLHLTRVSEPNFVRSVHVLTRVGLGGSECVYPACAASGWISGRLAPRQASDRVLPWDPY